MNHSATLNRGHYWAFIQDLPPPSWFFHNDELVFNVEENSFNNAASNILFYIEVKIFSKDLLTFFMVLQGTFVISDIVFGYDHPTYSPFSIRKLSVLTQFSGITTLPAVLSFGEAMYGKQAWSCLWGMVDLTLTLVHSTFNCGKAVCFTLVTKVYACSPETQVLVPWVIVRYFFSSVWFCFLLLCFCWWWLHVCLAVIFVLLFVFGKDLYYFF